MPVHAQNIAPNGDFEFYTVCPDGYGLPGAIEATPWVNANYGTIDYFHTCATSIQVQVPTHLIGYQHPHSGNAYAGFFAYINTYEYREYLQAPLLSPMIEGTCYDVSFYVNVANEFCGIVSSLGIHFSVTAPPWPDPIIGALDNLVPQITSNNAVLNDTVNWIHISGTYVAAGGEQYMTIGNFLSDAATNIFLPCNNQHYVYFYIDDVSVIAGDEGLPIDFDLGGPVEECDSYEIDPQIPDVVYLWETGSNAPSITVTESGVYSLTVSGECTQGIDSIEVTILGELPVEIGPPTYTLCEGAAYNIQLDPDAGMYEWQDGSTSPNYIIWTSGVYSVTLDDGCDLTSDHIDITFIEGVDIFSLGDDIHICDGQTIDYNFDPALGDFEWQDGSTSSTYSIASPGTYSLTITNDCGFSSDEIEITHLGVPQFSLGPAEQILCESSTIEFSFDPDLGDFIWQDGSTLPDFEINEPGTYGLTVTNACGSYAEEINVLLEIPPVFTFGDDITLCPVQTPYTLVPMNVMNAEMYLWGDGSNTTEYEVFENGTYNLTISNVCFSVSDEINILVEDEAPHVELPPDQSLCDGETILLIPPFIVGDFQWQDGTFDETYLVSQPGWYSLTITNECGQGSDSMLVEYVSAPPVPQLGPDISLCPGTDAVLYADDVLIPHVWQDGSVADSLIVTAAGDYILQYSNSCGLTSDTVTVTMNGNAPVVMLPADTTLCEGEAMMISSGISGVTYLWNDGTVFPNLTVTGPGTYSITVSNGCGADQDTIIIADGGLRPTVLLGPDISFCEGESVLILPVSTEVSAWLWQDGSVGNTYLAIQSDTIDVQVTNQCGLSYDTLIVTILPSTPTFELGGDTSICAGESIVLEIGIPNIDILWSDGSSLSALTITAPGIYFADISNGCGVASDSIEVSLLPDVPLLDLGNDQSLCIGEVITIDPGIPDVSYLWHDGSTNVSYQSTQQEIIILAITNSCGTSTDTLEVIESTQGPQLELGPDIKVCEGETVTIASGISGVDFLWHDNSILDHFITTVSGTFILEVSNNCGSDSDTVDVDISGVSPSTQLGNDTLLCDGEVFVLLASTDPDVDILWNDGSQNVTYTVSQEGTYILTQTNVCGQSADSISIEYLSAPSSFYLGNDTILCPGESVVLASPSVPDQLEWQDGSTGMTFLVDAAGVYQLTISNACGEESDDVQVSFDTRVAEVDLGADVEWCEGDVILLDASQIFVAEYSWSTGSEEEKITITTPGVYAVSVMAPCSIDADEVEIIPGDDCDQEIGMYLPNVFSPNDDGINDVFELRMGSDIEMVSSAGAIYDRWGNEVFVSDALPFSWNGKFQGSDVMPGVYVYLIKVKYLDGVEEEEEVLQGDVTLVR